MRFCFFIATVDKVINWPPQLTLEPMMHLSLK